MLKIANKESKRTVGWDGRSMIIQIKIANDLILTHTRRQNTFSHPFNLPSDKVSMFLKRNFELVYEPWQKLAEDLRVPYYGIWYIYFIQEMCKCECI